MMTETGIIGMRAGGGKSSTPSSIFWQDGLPSGASSGAVGRHLTGTGQHFPDLCCRQGRSAALQCMTPSGGGRRPP
jgi:hypothetical protein